MEIKDFATWLRHWRKKRGLTQERLVQLAHEVCKPAYISTLERAYDKSKKTGKPTRPSEEIVDALADALGRPRAEARRLAGHAAPDESTRRDGYDESEFALYHSKLKRLKPQQRRDFMVFWEAAKERIDHWERENSEQR